MTMDKMDKKEEEYSINELIAKNRESMASKNPRSPSLSRVNSDKLLSTPNLSGENAERAKKKWLHVQQNIISNMKAFDEDLKLKLTMNIDAIQQDHDVWALEQEKHI